MKEQAYTSIADLPEADRINYDRWLRDFVSPLTWTDAEIEEIARAEAMRHRTPHEL